MNDLLKMDIEKATRNSSVPHKPKVEVENEKSANGYTKCTIFCYGHGGDKSLCKTLRDDIQKAVGNRAVISYNLDNYNTAFFKVKTKDDGSTLQEGAMKDLYIDISNKIKEYIDKRKIKHHPKKTDDMHKVSSDTVIKERAEMTANALLAIEKVPEFKKNFHEWDGTKYQSDQHGNGFVYDYESVIGVVTDATEKEHSMMKDVLEKSSQGKFHYIDFDLYDSSIIVEIRSRGNILIDNNIHEGVSNMDYTELFNENISETENETSNAQLEQALSILESNIILSDAGLPTTPLLENVSGFSPSVQFILEAADDITKDGEEGLKEARKTGNLDKIKSALTKVKNYFFKLDEKSAAKVLPWVIRYVARLALGAALVSVASAALGLGGAAAAAEVASTKSASVILALLSEVIHFTVELAQRFAQNKINAKEADKGIKACEDTVKRIDKELKNDKIDQKRKNLLSIYRVRLNDFIAELEESKTQQRVIDMYKNRKENKEQTLQPAHESVELLQEGFIGDISSKIKEWFSKRDKKKSHASKVKHVLISDIKHELNFIHAKLYSTVVLKCGITGVGRYDKMLVDKLNTHELYEHEESILAFYMNKQSPGNIKKLREELMTFNLYALKYNIVVLAELDNGIGILTIMHEYDIQPVDKLDESVELLQEGFIGNLFHRKKNKDKRLHLPSSVLNDEFNNLKAELIKGIKSNSALSHTFKPLNKVYEHTVTDGSEYKVQEVIGSIEKGNDVHNLLTQILSQISSRFHYVTTASSEQSGPDRLFIYILSFDGIVVDNSIHESTELLQEEVTTKQRNHMDEDNFGLPKEKKYPMSDLAHVKSAITYFEKTTNPDDRKTLANNIIRRTMELDGKGKIFVHKGNDFYNYAPEWLKAKEPVHESAFDWNSLFSE